MICHMAKVYGKKPVELYLKVGGKKANEKALVFGPLCKATNIKDSGTIICEKAGDRNSSLMEALLMENLRQT